MLDLWILAELMMLMLLIVAFIMALIDSLDVTVEKGHRLVSLLVAIASFVCVLVTVVRSIV